MAGWNGSGVFTRAYDWTDEAAAGNAISSTKFDTENDAFSAGINACIAKNGENAATGDLPMGGNKHTGVADGTARAHYASVGQVQDGGAVWGGTSGGSANAQTITLSPAITAYDTGMKIAFLAGNTNTAATTINANGVGAKNIFSGGAALGGGEIQSGSAYLIIYDGTQFQLISGAASSMPAAKVTPSSSGAVVTGTLVGITFGTAIYEYPASMWDSGDAQFIVTPVSGVYNISAQVGFSGATTGKLELILVKYTGATPTYIAASVVDVSGGPPFSSCSTDHKATAGDKYGILVRQDSGTGWTYASGEGNTSLSVHMVRRV